MHKDNAFVCILSEKGEKIEFKTGVLTVELDSFRDKLIELGVGEMPTEMFLHFFKSLSDASKMNLNIKAEGQNEHHKIEGIFKALARALKMAVRRDIYHYELPSTKGML